MVRRPIRRRIAFLLVLLLAPAAAAARDFGAEADVHEFLSSRLAPAELGELGPSYVQTSFADLNHDGRLDALAYVTGNPWCGSGGCHLYVLENAGASYRLVGSIMISRPPIRILTERVRGWSTISVWVGGGGTIPGYEAKLPFSGVSYPENPTVSPARRYVPGGGARIVLTADQPKSRL